MSSAGQSTNPGQMNMAELLDSAQPSRTHRRGDVVEGTIMRADTDGILVNFGQKAEGVVPPAEMRTMTPQDVHRLKVGDEIITLVVRPETGDRAAILSIDRAVGEKGWRVLEKALESGASIEGKVIGFNRGGAIVEAEGVQGFVPMSQLISISRSSLPQAQEAPQPGDGEQGNNGGPKEAPEILENRTADVGKVLQLKLLEVSRARNRAIFSERQALQQRREEQKAKLIEQLKEGEVRKGTVTGTSSFGAFVDLGGADGLIHISELSWTPVNSPEDVVKVGDELDVYVLRVDAEKKKIGLSLRRLQPEPWQTITQRYQVDQIVNATITKLTNFGAFARVEGTDGAVEGLIHISELSSKMISHPREVVREGDSVKLKVLRIEPERRRLGLSLKQAEEEGEL